MTRQEQTREQTTSHERSGPPFPDWVFNYLINPLMSLILRSPLHGLVSGRLMLLTFTGRKSGRQFTTPVGYIREDATTLYVLTESPWWKNMRDGAPVSVHLQGRKRPGRAAASDDPKQAAHAVKLMVKQNGPDFARQRFGVAVSPDDSVEAIADSVQGTKVVRVELNR